MNSALNKTYLLVMILVSGLVAFTSCNNNDMVILPKPKPGGVYIPQALKNPVHIKLTGAQKVDTLEYSANIGGAGSANNDLQVSFAVNSSLVDEYNSAHSTAYTLLPQGNYTLIDKEAVIPAGTKHGPSLKLVIKDEPTVLVKDKEYLLPVTLKIKGGDMSVIENLQTVYFLVVSDIIPPPSGQGTTANPYKITNLDDLKWVSRHALAWNASYVQTMDINASETQDINGGKGFIPIGIDDTTFNGTYNGQGHTITGLYINRPGQTWVGLFAYTGSNAVIKNITLAQVNITGDDDAGGLVGFNQGKIIGDSVISGKVTGGSGDNIGGLIGFNQGSIDHSMANVTVTAQGENTGGLVGNSAGNTTIKNSHAAGKVSSKGKYVGGLVGYNSAIIDSCYATGAVHSEDTYAGGLIGQDNASVTNSYANGDVSGSGDNGGFIGQVGASGGSIGGNSVISHCYSTGAVKGTGSHTNGGFIGYFEGKSVEYCYETGDVTTVGNGATGGLVGEMAEDNQLVSHCHATGNVTNGDNQIGGLIGYIPEMNVPVEYCYATGDVMGGGNDKAGGLIGDTHAASAISYCYATGDVKIAGMAGGLVGYGSQKAGTIEYCFATGNVTSTGSYAGGLAGDIHQSVNNCYATGDASGSSYTGGLIGQLWDMTVTNSYSTGKATSPNGVGGLLGRSWHGGSGDGANKVINSYWDKQASGLSSSDGGGTGLTTVQMQGAAAQINMAGFDFTNVWKAQTGLDSYPVLINNQP